MHRHTWITTASTLVTIATLALVGCGGASDVGEQKSDLPTAKAVVIGQSFTPTDSPANGKISTTVRSGAEVILSGKESDSTSLPIVRFEWSPANAETGALVSAGDLLLLNSTTVKFTAPDVADGTKLLFELKVVDAKEQTSTAQVEVIVKEVRDPDRFLAYLESPRQIYVYTKVVTDIARGTSVADASFEVVVEPLVDYLPRVPAKESDGTAVRVIDEPLYCDESESDRSKTCRSSSRWHRSITWPISGTGASSECGASSLNPVLAFDIPVLDADEINLRYQHGDKDKMIELRDIDEASLKARISVNSLAGPAVVICNVSTEAPTVGRIDTNPATMIDTNPATMEAAAVALNACTPNVAGTATATATTTCKIDELLQAKRIAEGDTPSFDTAASATAYYDTIDPAPADEPLGPRPRDTLVKWFTKNGFDATAPNYGADVHAVYTNNLDLGFGRDMYAKKRNCDPGVEAPGRCDIAAVVFNYASLEAAAQKIGPIVAVAMEYTAGPTGGQRFTKFYAFAPDLRGDFRRVKSVNLDGRGEKFVPQSCVVCHGGRPAQVIDGTYKSSLPDGPDGDINSGWLSWDLKSFLYSDTDQGFSKKTDNATLSTLRNDLTRTKQEEAFRTLNHYAYLTFEDGVAGSKRYDLARELVTGWYGGAGGLAAINTKWADYPEREEALPAGWQSDKHADAPKLYEKVFAPHCRACHVVQALEQKPMGSYADFMTLVSGQPTLLKSNLESGEMPFARLTLDRFWVAPNGEGESAASILKRHFEGLPTAPFGVPGTPQAFIEGFPDPIAKGEYYRLSGLNSRFAASKYSWLPTLELLFENTALPLFKANAKGSYTVTLDVADDAESRDTRSSSRSDEPLSFTAPPDSYEITLAPGKTSPPIPVTVQGGDIPIRFDIINPAPTTVTNVVIADGKLSLTAGPAESVDSVVISLIATDSDYASTNDPKDTARTFITVNVKSALTANDCIMDVLRIRPNNAEGWLAETIDLKNKCVSGGDAGRELAFEVVTRSDGSVLKLDGQDGPKGTLDASDRTGLWKYTPPKGRMTIFKGATELVVDEPDRFEFKVYYKDAPLEVVRTAMPSIRIVGKSSDVTSFRTLWESLETSCGDCHKAPAGTYSRWLGTDANKEAFCRMTKGADSESMKYWSGDNGPGLPYNSDKSYVDRKTPDASALYLKPLGKLSHQLLVKGTNDVNIPAGVIDDPSPGLEWNYILRWVQEGAYFTEGSEQGCPASEQ